jgi:uncharacterized protein YqeY
MRAQEQARVNAIRLLIASLEKAQEELGKQAFDPDHPDETTIPADREQTLSRQTIQEVIRTEMERRRESVEQFRTHGQRERADSEESEIAVLEQYLTTI